jgi:hypothetical protein
MLAESIADDLIGKIMIVPSCNDCIYVDVPSGHMPCTSCSFYYTSEFTEKVLKEEENK